MNIWTAIIAGGFLALLAALIVYALIVGGARYERSISDEVDQ